MWRDRLLVLGLTLLLFLPFLGSFGLWDPWETHYGEVGRQLTERGDWISTWWGSHWKNAQGGQEGTWFFSKPILLMWLMALGLETFGFSEWGIRLGVTLVAVGGVVAGWSAGERIWGRRAAWWMALVLATSPFYFFLSRQAQTDMPFVGNMTIGLCCFMMGLFGRDRDEAPSRLGALLLGGVALLLVGPQLGLIGAGLAGWRGEWGPVGAFFAWGPTQAVLYGALLLISVGSALRSGEGLRMQRLYMLGFYLFVGLATLAKGLLGFLLPGAFIFLYLVLTGQWRRLREMELLRGPLLFIAVTFPWYVAMLVRHGNAFYQRFFVHDHFKRLSAGVHQIDSGSFEHYVKWLGYGLWPWVGFLPAALARLFVVRGLEEGGDRAHARLFLAIWAIFTFTLFTLSSTKFHHYCFPAVPALAMLIALLLSEAQGEDEDATPGRGWAGGLLVALAVGLIGVIGWDLVSDPQHWKNLFSYKYDRKWDPAWNAGFQQITAGLLAMAALGAAGMAWKQRRGRQLAAGLLAAAAVGTAVFGLDHYMPTISSTWSQKGIWDTYYARCTGTEGPPGHDAKKRYCAEQVITYKLNWRGETYYTQNEVIPIREDEEFTWFLKQNKDRPFYAVMEYSRFTGEFSRKLPAELKGKACKIDERNLKFVLVQVPCAAP